MLYFDLNQKMLFRVVLNNDINKSLILYPIETHYNRHIKVTKFIFVSWRLLKQLP